MVKREINANEAPTHFSTSSSLDLSHPARPRSISDAAPVRVRQSHVDWIAARMSNRDWMIAGEVNKLRVATGQQLERLCFSELATARSRTVTRSRVLARLVRWRVLVAVGRRVGGREKGSTAQVFALDSAGQRLLAQHQLADGEKVRVRRPGSPGVLSLRHSLAVAELYVELTEQAHSNGFNLATFKAEPGAHWPNGVGGWLKPDAYAVLEYGPTRDHWWIEVDLATESLPVVRAKLETYLDFQRRGQLGPDDVTPWVLVTAITPRRRDAIASVVRQLPGAGDLVTVIHSAEAARHLYEVLRE